MRFIWTGGLTLILTILTVVASALAQDVQLKGINANAWYTWPRFNGWDKPGVYVPPIPHTRRMPVAADFNQIAEMSFSAVRLGVDPALFMGLEGKPRRNMEQRILLTVDQAVSAGLIVIFDMHPNSRHKLYGQSAFSSPADSSGIPAYVKAVAEAAHLLKDYPRGKVLLELMNEPRAPCAGADSEFWLVFLDRMIDAATEAAPELPLVISGACTSSIEGLLALNASRWHRRDMLFTFHFYEPFPFTHQSAPFTPWAEKHLSGLRWPPGLRTSTEGPQISSKSLAALPEDKRAMAESDARAVWEKYAESGTNRDSLRARLALVADWADRQGISRSRVLMGEFGVYRGNPGEPGASCEDRAAWAGDVVSIADEFGFSWSYFHLDGPFGLLRGIRRTADTELLEALGLKKDGRCPS